MTKNLCANGGGLGAKTGLYAVEDNTKNKYKNFQKFGSYYTWENKKGEINTQCNRASDIENYALTIACSGDSKVVVEDNLKTQLCNDLIANGKVKENDVIRHSYSTSRMSGKMNDIQQNNISPTLDTRCDCLGVVVNESQLTTKNKRLASMLNKIDIEKTQAIDIYNQSTHDEMHTIKTNVDSSNMTAVTQNLRIRKLTPKECFRLMGVKDEDFEKVAKNQSNASLYHLAGDALITTIIMGLVGQITDINYIDKIDNFKGWWKK